MWNPFKPKAKTPYNENPYIETAHRILLRGSVNPKAYEPDPRYVLFFACSHLAGLISMKGDMVEASDVVGEDVERVKSMMVFAGFDLDELVTGEPKNRFLQAMAKTTELFPDIEQKYGK